MNCLQRTHDSHNQGQGRECRGDRACHRRAWSFPVLEAVSRLLLLLLLQGVCCSVSSTFSSKVKNSSGGEGYDCKWLMDLKFRRGTDSHLLIVGVTRDSCAPGRTTSFLAPLRARCFSNCQDKQHPQSRSLQPGPDQGTLICSPL